MRPGRLVGPMAVLLGAALAARGEPAPAGPLRLTIDEAVKMGLVRNPDMASADLEIEAAEASRLGARGMMLPRLNVGWQGALYTSALDLNFAIPGLPPGSIPPMTVRDPFTWTASVQIVQPISA